MAKKETSLYEFISALNTNKIGMIKEVAATAPMAALFLKGLNFEQRAVFKRLDEIISVKELEEAVCGAYEQSYDSREKKAETESGIIENIEDEDDEDDDEEEIEEVKEEPKKKGKRGRPKKVVELEEDDEDEDDEEEDRPAPKKKGKRGRPKKEEVKKPAKKKPVVEEYDDEEDDDDDDDFEDFDE